MVGMLELTEGRGRPQAERWTLLGLELLRVRNIREAMAVAL